MMMSVASEKELSDVVAGAEGALRIVGGGTRGVGGSGAEVSVAGLSGIALYEPGALTIVAGSGTPVAEIETALAAEGQRLPFEPMDMRALLGREGVPTIGGVVATNASGPRRIQAGACRDSLIGVRFVDGRGDVIKNGGRVMKNVTGYDLVKLLAGSFGSLGVLSQVSFKVLPIAEAAASLEINGLDSAQAVGAMSKALGSPFEVNGAAHIAAAGEDGARTLVRVEGFAKSVAYRAEQLQKLLGGFGDVAACFDTNTVADTWQDIRDVRAFAGAPGAVWKVSLRPSRSAGFAEELRRNNVAHRAIYDWGGGLLWLLVPQLRDGGARVIRAQVAKLGGHATLVRADDDIRAAVPMFQTEPAPLAAISAGLRAQFDPRGILNPGVMG